MRHLVLLFLTWSFRSGSESNLTLLFVEKLVLFSLFSCWGLAKVCWINWTNCATTMLEKEKKEKKEEEGEEYKRAKRKRRSKTNEKQRQTPRKKAAPIYDRIEVEPKSQKQNPHIFHENHHQYDYSLISLYGYSYYICLFLVDCFFFFSLFFFVIVCTRIHDWGLCKLHAKIYIPC